MGVAASAALVVVLASAAFLAAPVVPGVNEVVIALVLGIMAANVRGGRAALSPAVSNFMLKFALTSAVILMGAGVDLALIRSVGVPALAVISGSVVTGIVISLWVGRRQGLGKRPALLVGVGTAICGASAIAAVAPIIRAKEHEVGMALVAVFGFNAIALVAYPVIGGLAGFDQVLFGTWAGAAVHDTASSVATGFTMGPQAGEVATVVKLVRVLFLIPLLAVITGTVAVREAAEGDGVRGSIRSIWSSVPWFVFGFAALATLNALGWLGGIAEMLGDAAKVIIVFVVAAIGLSLRFKQLARVGRKTFATGLVASSTVGVVSLVLIHLLGIGAA